MFVSTSFICLIKFVACLWSCCTISVDGGYSNWGSYTSCSATCGGGEQVRTRQCNNPTPQYKGKDCKWIGPANETRACNTFYCPSELVTSVCCSNCHCRDTGLEAYYFYMYLVRLREIVVHNG